MATDISSNGHNVAKNINKGVNKTKRATHMAANRAKRGADTLDAKVSHLAEDTGAKLHELYNSGIDHAEEGAEQARTAVRDNPLLAVAGAFFGGFILSALMRR